MKYYFLLLFSLSISCLPAQKIEVEKETENTFNIRISDMTKLADFTTTAEDQLLFNGNSTKIRVQALDKGGNPIAQNGVFKFKINRKDQALTFINGIAELDAQPVDDKIEFHYLATNNIKEIKVRAISAWWSIIPPMLAIIFALVFREVIPSMVLGIFSGALIYAGFSPGGIVEAFKSLIDYHILNALADSGHIAIIIFSMIIGGMVAVISKNGGMAGIVDSLSRYAKSPRSSQVVTWFLGILIFFDDYANTLVVGNTMRPVTDRFKVSREKLAYIVDSTAAPVAAIAFITTWIGAELGYIDDAIKPLGIQEGAYSIFLNSLQYAFYPVLTLVFMFLLIWMKKDFGPMLKAEREARTTTENQKTDNALAKELEEFEPLDGTKRKWFNALLPILTVILLTIIGLFYTGEVSSKQQLADQGIVVKGFSAVWQNLGALGKSDEVSFVQKLGIIIGNSDSYQALLWSSLAGLALAIALSISQKILSVKESFEATLNGFKAMLPAFVILTLAWSLASVTEQLKTAEFLTSIFSDSIGPIWIAGITFVLAGLVSFSTGSSWGTMAILYPLIIPTSFFVCKENGLSQTETMEIIYNVVSVVLAGSVLGDHCSPISDTTILSSMATQCNHISHVKTQLPYAVAVGGVSLILSLLFVNLGLPWFINYPVGIGLVFLIVRFLGKPIQQTEA